MWHHDKRRSSRSPHLLLMKGGGPNRDVVTASRNTNKMQHQPVCRSRERLQQPSPRGVSPTPSCRRLPNIWEHVVLVWMDVWSSALCLIMRLSKLTVNFDPGYLWFCEHTGLKLVWFCDPPHKVGSQQEGPGCASGSFWVDFPCSPRVPVLPSS